MSRLFLAIELPPAIEADLDEAVDPLRAAFRDLRWVPPSRWHITVEFLGECGRHEAERQRTRWADRAGRAEPLDCRLADAGAFAHPWKARVLWVGVAVDAAGWHRLAGPAQQPHLTVARTRESRDLTGAVQSLSTYWGLSWRVDEIALVESHLHRSGDRGPRYEPLERFSLGGG